MSFFKDFPFQFKTIQLNELSYSTLFVTSILGLFIFWFTGFMFVWTKTQIANTLRGLGVALQRISRTIKELERKTFHISGLLLPINYHLLLTFVDGFTKYHGQIIVTVLTSFWFICDTLRIKVDIVGRNFPLQSIARPEELTHYSGVTWFMLGNWLAVMFFPPRIAICGLLFMIIGDMSAAVFGISFGKTKLYGKKSLQGTFAMFVVCVIIGVGLFIDVHMREYPVVLAAFVASVTELYEPFGINDNMTISLFSCLALQFGFHRIATCERFDWRLIVNYKRVDDLVFDTGYH